MIDLQSSDIRKERITVIAADPQKTIYKSTVSYKTSATRSLFKVGSRWKERSRVNGPLNEANRNRRSGLTVSQSNAVCVVFFLLEE
jgi:hypothetical protein